VKKRGQNLLEYILIFAMIAIAGYAFVAKFDLKSIKNYVFSRPTDSADSTKIKIEAMTE
jgi:hypothetical protein